MPIDASIPLNVRPVQFQTPDRGQTIARAMQIQGLGNQNRLAELQFASAEREQQQADKLNTGYQSAMNPDGTIDRNKLFQYMATEGLGSKLPGVQKTFTEQDNATLEADTKKFELGLKKFDAMGQVFGAVSQAPTVENAQAAISQLAQIGALTPEQAQQAIQTIPQDPAQIKALADKYLISSLSAKDQLQQQLDQQKFAYQKENDTANRGVTVRGQDITMRGQDMSRDTTIRGQDLSRSTAIRGQDLTNARGLESNNIARTKQEIEMGQAEEKRQRQQQGATAQADRIINKVDQALGKVNWATAGIVEGIGSVIPGANRMSGAKDLAADLQTIKANLGFAELQAMRDASPTGGALGQVAVQELEALQSTVASLDQAQSPEQLEARLGEIKQHYQNWKKTVSQQNNIIPSGAGAGTINNPSKVMQDADAILGL